MSKDYNEWYWKLYRWIRWELPYQHKYIKYGVKNLYKWFWIIWKDRDWDYYYIFQVLKFKLEKQAKHLSERNWHENSKRDAELMMTCVRLIDKVQNESYYDEYYDESKPMTNESIHKCQAQHNKAKRLLFKIMNDRIEEWWD
jgi:hypothetical protein